MLSPSRTQMIPGGFFRWRAFIGEDRIPKIRFMIGGANADVTLDVARQIVNDLTAKLDLADNIERDHLEHHVEMKD